jgi:hypothetical protein
VRIYNDAGALGTTGMTLDQIATDDALRAEEEGVLIVPPNLEKSRFNVGIRTLEQGATIAVTVRTAAGNITRTVTKSFPPVFFTQLPAAALVETELFGSDSIRFRVEAGSAILYGAATDNVTQDPAAKVVRRLE